MRIHLLLPALVICSLNIGSDHLRANEPIRFCRTPDISPNGNLVAFSYQGDIWTVAATGGKARILTMHQDHEIDPAFSPEGRNLAFSSNRHGQYDIFVVPVEGGRPKRLTFHSQHDHACGWTPDGKYVLFYSRRSIQYPFGKDLYKVPVTGGKVQRVTFHGGRMGRFSPDGKHLAYVRGNGAWYRKGYRGSANDEIWICDEDGTNHKRFTQYEGNDNSPVWSQDGKSLFYVSDNGSGQANIFRQDIRSTKPKQITHHKSAGVRRIRLSGNGQWLVYECGVDIWMVSTRGGRPRKLFIEALADYKTNPQKIVTYNSSGVTEFAVAPNERHIAFVIRGEIFLIPRGGGRARQLTHHPANDHGLTWSWDSNQLIFLSDRNGQEDVFRLTADDPIHPRLVDAHHFQVKQVTDTPEAEIGLRFSPNGKRISFVRSGRLVSMKPDGSDEKIIVDRPMVIDYEWSPNSKWVCYSRLDGSFASEMYLIPSGGATAKNPARNITRYATYNAGLTWSHSGTRIAFISDRSTTGEKNAYVLYLQKPAASSARPTDEFDWDNIHLRARRVSSMPTTSVAVSKSGKMVAFRATSSSGEEDLWVADTSGSKIQQISKNGLEPKQIHWSRLLSSLIYFRSSSGSIYMVSHSNKSGPLKVPFQARMTVDRQDEYREIFEQSWRTLSESFYDPSFHGVNWKAIRKKYLPIVNEVVTKEDLVALINLMVGELNSSHVGISSPAAKSDAITGYLGLDFDEKYAGPGLKITGILKRGPADRRGIKLKSGDFIVKINRVDLTPKVNVAELLAGKVGETISLEVASDPRNPRDRRHIELRATSRNNVAILHYEQWVEQQAEAVDRLSKGKLGYIHIYRMDKEGLKRFRRSLFSDNFDKAGIVLDVRYNPGGYIHDKILNFLNGTTHTFFAVRDGGVGNVFRFGDRKWSKPLVLLVNQRSSSDTEIFFNGFRTLGLGKVVGTPTGGKVLGTRVIRLIDGSKFQIPRTAIFSAKGQLLEKKGLIPDVLVENLPDQLSRGQDTQLQKAVHVLIEDVARWKKTQPKVTFNPKTGSPNPGIEAGP